VSQWPIFGMITQLGQQTANLPRPALRIRHDLERALEVTLSLPGSLKQFTFKCLTLAWTIRVDLATGR
jgi:hypothetical protein